MHDHISPEIFKFNSCSYESYVYEKNNEVHIDEGITDTESDVEMFSAIDNFYDFKPLNTDSKKKLCNIVKIPTKKNSKKITPNIYNMGPTSTTKTITGDGNCLFRAISHVLSNRQEFFGNAIYLQHIGNINHYEVVTNVTPKYLSPNPLQCRQGYAEKYQVGRKSEVSSKDVKVDENQITGLVNNLGNCNTESIFVSKAEKERIKYQTDDEFRARKTNISKRKYWENEGIRSKKF
ncbi:unnamed protein product [Mytilus coruscus]|uniref:OTU domain-containing protein n=1 Tax=Mytilus coruscus TaxID=42192 RepID=A0A6J8AMM7_MYTCO|nr:unnamed protein product [Mytilus coruscus]